MPVPPPFLVPGRSRPRSLQTHGFEAAGCVGQRCSIWKPLPAILSTVKSCSLDPGCAVISISPNRAKTPSPAERTVTVAAAKQGETIL